jgi:amidase
MKIVPRDKVIYSFSPRHKPIEHVKPGEQVLIQTEDAFGGQIRSEKDSVSQLDWLKVDGATGPLFIEDAEVGDTLVVEILDINVDEKGIIVTVPKSGILGEKSFSPSTKIVQIRNGYVEFDESVRVRADPMIGTIGVTPNEEEIPTGSLGRHGGNMDAKEIKKGTKLYLPVLTKGALFAIGDVHAVQGDGELCVSAIEVAGEALLKFNLIKGKTPEWPTLQTEEGYALLACGETLDEAAKLATEAAVKAFVRQYGWSFEKAYMFGSLAVDLRINQVVDPKKGVRAVISRNFITMESLLT